MVASLAIVLGASLALSASAKELPSAADCCWCDGDTPDEKRKVIGSEGKEYVLIMSDEFNELGRSLADGKDPKWTALNESDYTNSAAVRYMPESVTTAIDRGAMVRVDKYNQSNSERVWVEYDEPVRAMKITTENISDPAFAKAVNKSFTSGMVQGWNKFCFTGGIVEIRAKFTMGLGFWPALWLFGNLGRAIYQKSNDGLWPFSYEDCDEAYEKQPFPGGATPQRISGCDPNPGPGLHPYQGRGATELDLVEVGDSFNGAHGWVMSSLQLSPAIPPHFRPKLGTQPVSYPLDKETGTPYFKMPESGETKDTWYHGLKFGGNNSCTHRIGSDVYCDQDGGVPQVLPNAQWYGPEYADSLTGGVNPFADLSEKYRTYRLEWKEPEDGEEDGYLRWYIDDTFIFEVPQSVLGKYSVCSEGPGEEEPKCYHTPKRTFPAEPASVVMNVAVGSWNGGPSSLTKDTLPGEMFVDYVRVWQRPDKLNIGCDPPDHPTKEYIHHNKELYGGLVSPEGDETCAAVYPRPKRVSIKRGFAAVSTHALVIGTLVTVGVVALGFAGYRHLRRKRDSAAADAQSDYLLNQ